MATTLNSYVLPDHIIKKMREKIEESREKKIELGFGLCRLSHVSSLRVGDECVGDVCTLKRIASCPIGTYVGGYHTHPRATAEPSIADLKSAYIRDVECVGSVKEDAIKCYVRIGHRKTDNERHIIKAEEEIEKPLPKWLSQKEYDIWKRTRDEILNKHFKQIDVRQ